jgi:hypothetical protein
VDQYKTIDDLIQFKVQQMHDLFQTVSKTTGKSMDEVIDDFFSALCWADGTPVLGEVAKSDG